jgi:hypothetical protein
MMGFAKTHVIGIVLGIVAYELYHRQAKPSGG